jgi:hypothetical protein
MLEWLKDNEILSGAAAVLLTGIGFLIKHFFFPSRGTSSSEQYDTQPSITINNSNAQGTVGPAVCTSKPRRDTRILFVDDDTKFKVVKIMKAAGWPNVSIKKDIRDLDSLDVRDADVLFIDIQGVGSALSFGDEGLGLALAVKQKYPEKKVVIYSAQTAGDRFHKALKKADGSLAKNADPYEFIALLHELTDA